MLPFQWITNEDCFPYQIAIMHSQQISFLPELQEPTTDFSKELTKLFSLGYVLFLTNIYHEERSFGGLQICWYDQWKLHNIHTITWLILGLRPANVTASLIGWVQALNQTRYSTTVTHPSSGTGLNVHQECKESATLVRGQNGEYFADEIFRCIFLMKIVVYLFKFHWRFFHLFRWLSVEQETNHYFNQW